MAAPTAVARPSAPPTAVGGKSITQQIDEGIRFHTSRRHSATGYLAYFQSYSNTYAPLDILRMRYEEALVHPLVSGLVIGTRPDCVDEEKLDYLASLSKQHYIMVEYGIESCYVASIRKVASLLLVVCATRL